MCGIVGLFLKDKALEPELGALLTTMLVTMSDRGPDSAGIAIYGDPMASKSKLVLQSDSPQTGFADLDTCLSAAIGAPVEMAVKSTHAVLTLPSDQAEAAREIRWRFTKKSGCPKTSQRALRLRRWAARMGLATRGWRRNLR